MSLPAVIDFLLGLAEMGVQDGAALFCIVKTGAEYLVAAGVDGVGSYCPGDRAVFVIELAHLLKKADFFVNSLTLGIDDELADECSHPCF